MQKKTGGDPLAAKQEECEIKKKKKNEKQGMGNYILNIIRSVIPFCRLFFFLRIELLDFA